MAIYRDSTGLRAPLTAAMGLSSLYIGLVTHNFVEDIRNGDLRLLKEVEAAKAFNLHCILLLFDNLTLDDKKLVEKIFQNHKILRKYENVPSTQEKFKQWTKKKTPELKKLMAKLDG